MGLHGLTRLLQLLELEQRRVEAANKHSAMIALQMSFKWGFHLKEGRPSS